MTPLRDFHIGLTLKGEEPNFKVLSFTGRESLDEPYRFDLDVLCPYNLDLERLMRTTGCLTYGEPGADKPQGLIHGRVYRAERVNWGAYLNHYRITLMPLLAYLDHRRGHRIFQHQTVPQIIAQVLCDHGIPTDIVAFRLCTTYPLREYCVQYNETDLAFIQRLCEEEGIHFHFEHSPDEHTLVFGDERTAFASIDSVTFQQATGLVAPTPVIDQLLVQMTVCASHATLRDYSFTTPSLTLEGNATGEAGPDLEQYRYPGRFQTEQRGKHLATRALERARRDACLAKGQGDVPTLHSGHVMPLIQHPCASSNRRWLIREVHHHGKQPPLQEQHLIDDLAYMRIKPDATGGFTQGYRNGFVASPDDLPYRPADHQRKPRIIGEQTAVVTGPPGEEIHCDVYGRVKVQFHWDREGQADAFTSCWIRVASNWSGNRYGSAGIPSVGMEVLVSYLNGDPDRPIIVGCLHNALNQVPYPLPEHKTRSTFKTLSSPGGDGENELRIDDRKDAEQIYLHAERDWVQHIRHDQHLHVGHARHDTVEGHAFNERRQEEHRSTHLDRKTDVRGSDHLSVDGTLHRKVGNNLFVEAGETVLMCAGKKFVLEAGVELTIKVGNNFVKVDPSGVTLNGDVINLNSGGEPGSIDMPPVLTPLAPTPVHDERAGRPITPARKNAAPDSPSPANADATPEAREEALEEEEEEVEIDDFTLRIGVFFDGTGNNRSNSEKVQGCLAPDVNLADAAADIQKFCAAHGYDAEGHTPDNSYGNDVSNVARLYDLYHDRANETLDDHAQGTSIAVYVEGIGTSSTGEDSRYSQATGLGAQGVRARVKEVPKLIFGKLRALKQANPDLRISRIEFDIFGFSRGAAAARDFANEISKGKSSLLAKRIPAGAWGLADEFIWEWKSDVCINFIGLYDTVAAISNPLIGDLDGNNAWNPGINIRLPSGIAKKIVHLVAEHEYRFNFALNSAGAEDIVLPGAHSDLGGGYLPRTQERVLLSKPVHSIVDQKTDCTKTSSYAEAEASLKQLQDRLLAYNPQLEIVTWEVLLPELDGQRNEKRAYAAVSSQREVRSDLSLVYLRIMRELAVQHGVPFREIAEKDSRLALPEDLIEISEKLSAYALGKSAAHQLTQEEQSLIFRKYVHFSNNWNAVKNFNNSDLSFLFINRPQEESVRTVHPNE